jgi:hypothetical protein
MPDGTLIRHGFGPTDKTTQAPGTWKFDGKILALRDDARGAASQKLKIVSAGPDRLVFEG